MRLFLCVFGHPSPLQCLKQVRLHRALTLMAYDGRNAGTAAEEGCRSASQFGREFERLFGRSPAQEATRMRAHAGPAQQTTPGV